MPHDQTADSHPPRHKGVLMIAVLKLVKASLLIIIGLGALSLLHRNVSEVAEHLMRFLHVDPDGKFFYAIIDKLEIVDDRKLRQLSAGTFFYAALLLTEGLGLWFEKRWAEWLTVIITGSFIPYEIYEIFLGTSVAKFSVLAINLAVVIYLSARLRVDAKSRRSTVS